jgi:Homeodomain-like domain
VSAKRIAVKKYIVTLSDEERERLSTLIRAGKHRAGQLVRARILLKADTSSAGAGWSDSQIASALDTSVATVARTRQQLVEEGFEAVLTRKHSPASARARIFDGAAEAKLIALACSEPPKGRARWTLQLLEAAVVELNIVARASDNTIGRTLKKTLMWTAPREQRLSASSQRSLGLLHGCTQRNLSRKPNGSGCVRPFRVTVMKRPLKIAHQRVSEPKAGLCRTPIVIRPTRFFV